MVDFIKVNQPVPIEFLNMSKWEECTYKSKRTGQIEKGLRTFIGKLNVTYSLLTQTMYVKGRLINIVEKSYYLNFDDFENYQEMIKKCFIKANRKLNELFIQDFIVDISQMHVTQIEYSFNIKTKFKKKYIEILNKIYSDNRNDKFKRYKNYPFEMDLDFDSSFYLKTKADFINNRKTTFCLDIYDKQDQLKNKAAKNKKECGKTKVPIADINASEDILRIECKAYYEYINSLCSKFKISNNLENLFDIEIVKFAVISKIKYLFGSGDFYTQAMAESKVKNLKLKADLHIHLSKLTEYFAKDRKKVLTELSICPYGFIPEDWGIDMLENPIKLISEKTSKL